MAKRRAKKSGPGVPEWIVTFSDMMSLLLCFFILLAAFSELKKEHKYMRVVRAVQDAFGYSGGVGVMPTNEPPLRSMIELLETLAKQSLKESKVSQSTDRGIHGKHAKVSKIHEGLMFTVGGHITFEPGSAEIKPEAKEELLRVAKLLKGRNNKIAVRGHAARKLLPEGSTYTSLRDLSYFRAAAVADFLSGPGGLRPELLIVEARADSEPLVVGNFAGRDAANRRVEVILTEILHEDLHADHDASDEQAARAGLRLD